MVNKKYARIHCQAVSMAVEIYEPAGCVGGVFSRDRLMELLELPDITKAKIRWCDHLADPARIGVKDEDAIG